MLTRLRIEGDDDWRDIEELYGKPQHETGGQTSDQALYGEPQHDVHDYRSPPEFDPDLGYALNWLDHPVYTSTSSYGLQVL
ncbi:hypothetical protein [Haladaptatus sp. NG-WS-4]